ncbi:site-specific DNA-methyltransferase [Mycobacterium avium]|uniref:site-specific DNA-methyltransferase n=1 Tax=Mycobacterium avium TaxID=1764 RepID=UPI001E36D148|nr:site-specific DNA-methyltransferase [Mycobacterium avium]
MTDDGRRLTGKVADVVTNPQKPEAPVLEHRGFPVRKPDPCKDRKDSSMVTHSITVPEVKTFKSVRRALGDSIADETADALVCMGDSLPMLRRLPDQSVSLIVTDPPYHSTKKGNIYNDTAFQEDEHFLEWIEQYTVEWRRILKRSGTLYLFCSSQMSARLEVMMAKYLRPINHITWTKPNEPGYDGWKGKMKKEALRNWYPHSERILVFEHGGYGTWEAYRRSPMGEYLLECRQRAGITTIQLTELIGEYGKVNHGGAVTNWEAGRNIPSREQYRKLVESLAGYGVTGMLDYNDLIRPMIVSKDVEFTDVWNFMSVRPFKGKHPAEKPQDMLMHIIQASSYPGDIVLDCFAGSGSTGVAALRLGRRAVCMELDESWVKRAAKEI